jgi:hypothetical protein
MVVEKLDQVNMSCVVTRVLGSLKFSLQPRRCKSYCQSSVGPSRVVSLN